MNNKLTGAQITMLADMARWPQRVPNSKKGIMARALKLFDAGYCTQEAYLHNYREAIYEDGVKFTITREGVQALLNASESEIAQQFKVSHQKNLESVRKELEKVEARAAELRAYIAIYGDEAMK